MKAIFEDMMEDEEWSWDDLAKALLEKFKPSELSELINMLFENAPEILEEVSGWTNVINEVNGRLKW